jgi:hypothetical protein
MSEDTMTHTTKDAVPNLLPCPFCGGKAYLITGRSVAWARCTGCRAEGPHFNAAAEKTNLWNRRAPTAEQAEGVLDDERAAFEAWAAETYGNDDDDSGVSLERQDDGYLYSGVDDAWNGWQARAASPQATEDTPAKLARDSVRMLEGYAESYESMAKMDSKSGDGTVQCRSVARDIRANMAGWFGPHLTEQATATQPAQTKRSCEWHRSAGVVFKSGCDAVWAYGDPTDRGARYCCYCGDPVLVRTEGA